MTCYTLGERERFAQPASDLLAQGVVPSLHVRGFTGLLAHALAAFVGKDVGAFAAEGIAPVAVDEGFDRPGVAAHRCSPPPTVAGAYFNHADTGVRYAKCARNTTQARPFLVRSHDFHLAFIAVLDVRLQHLAGTAVFAGVLRVTAGVAPVLEMFSL